MKGPRRVLVVSDRELWLRSLDSVLGLHGYLVVPAVNGREAIERMELLRPDVVIIHATLQDMPSLTLCRELRERGRSDTPTPLIVIGSGPCTRDDRLSALRAGAWERYGFPLDPETLLLKLEIYASARMEALRPRTENPPEGMATL